MCSKFYFTQQLPVVVSAEKLSNLPNFRVLAGAVEAHKLMVGYRGND